MASAKAYYRLAKPGIIYGNLLTAAAGFLLACRWHIDWALCVSLLLGTSLVIGGACVYNNCLDRKIDVAMKRTKKRATVTGEISLRTAIAYGTVLMLLGFALLVWQTNWPVLICGIVGVVDYVAAYGWTKRHSTLSTIIGGVSGSMPIVAGYVAVTGRFDATSLILFLIMNFWQLAHFYAIGLYRRRDYAAAHLPIMPVVRPAATVRRHILLNIVLFWLATLALSIVGSTGYIFAGVMTAFCVFWVLYKVPLLEGDGKIWGRQVFFNSLWVLLALSGCLTVGALVA